MGQALTSHIRQPQRVILSLGVLLICFVYISIVPRNTGGIFLLQQLLFLIKKALLGYKGYWHGIDKALIGLKHIILNILRVDDEGDIMFY